jgi:hypothetical protein
MQPIGEHAKSQGLRRGESGFPRRTADHHPGEIGDGRDPATLDFSFQLDHQAHEEKDTTSDSGRWKVALSSPRSARPHPKMAYGRRLAATPLCRPTA